jgi:hypothetical protein
MQKPNFGGPKSGTVIRVADKRTLIKTYAGPADYTGRTLGTRCAHHHILPCWAISLICLTFEV